MKKTVQVANVVRTAWPPEPNKHVNLYQGSGRWGASFNAHGLMDATPGPDIRRCGRTQFYHADHWHRGKWNIDHHVALARLHWASSPPGEPETYRQELDLYTGVLTTQFQRREFSYRLTTSFSPDHRDLLLVRLDYRGRMPALALTPVAGSETSYGDKVRLARGTTFAATGPRLWAARVRQGTANSTLAVRILEGQAALQIGKAWIVNPRGQSGSLSFLIGAAGHARHEELLAQMSSLSGANRLAASFRRAWARRWGKIPLEAGDKNVHALCQRSLYQIFCSYAPEPRAPAPPMGWSGGYWGFHFPQDLSYIHPVLLRLGHLDIARAQVEFYAGRIGQMQEMTRRIYDKPGTMWAWEFPIDPAVRQLPNGAPNHFQYEVHNAAYPAKMAFETAKMVDDPAWVGSIAWPVVAESARFLASILWRKGRTWSLHVKPSMGQDEFGGRDAENYLCALFAAEYALKTALAMSRRWQLELPERTAWQKILREGLAYPTLLQAGPGIYATSGRRNFQLGRQKHPVQLNPLFILPLEQVDEPTRKAYQLRHQLCRNENDHFPRSGAGSFYHGWTLVAYLLAAANSGDAEGVEHEWKQFLPSHYADADFMQLYESSGYGWPYYTTSSGLFLQAVIEAATGSLSGRPGSAWPSSWGVRRPVAKVKSS